MKTVLITGAGIGIGRATALAFSKTGYRVIVTDILKDEGAAVVSEINKDGGVAKFYFLDVTSTDNTNSVVESVERNLAQLTQKCNAGIAHKAPLDQLTDEKWDYLFDIDLKGMFKVIRPALASMKAAKTGSIICLSSCMGVMYGWDEHVHYSSAKAGVVGLVRGLANELARDGIKVNGVAPGYIRTAQLLSEEHSLGKEGADKAGSFIPMGRIGEPDDIADVIVFLASHEARYLTGQVISVDGGLAVGRY